MEQVVVDYIVTISISDECKMWSVGAADNQVLTQVACDTLLRKTQSKYQLTNNVHLIYISLDVSQSTRRQCPKARRQNFLTF